MVKQVDALSVFFPAYNEEKNIKKTVSDAKKVLQKVAGKWEIIIVDDGSKDKTGKISDSLAKENKNISVIHHCPNRGYGGALKSGYEKAKYEWVAFTDSDGQFDFAEITKFLEKKDQADLILGIRKNRSDTFIRKIYTLVWSRILPRILFGLNVTDYSCGFWLIKKDVYEKVKPIISEEKVTKIEMLVKAKRQGFKFTEVQVDHYPRKAGSQTGANARVIVKSVLDLFELYKRLR